MGQREISVKESVTHSVAEIALYIESQGLIATAEAFAEDFYAFITKLADSRRAHSICRDPIRALIGYKCISYKKKYTIVFFETDETLTVCEFLPSKNIHW